MQADKTIKTSLSKEKAQNILATVPYEHGFHFFTDVGKYTGETAISLFSFYEELSSIEIEALLFHFPRGDFQKWIRNTLGDSELSERIDKMNTDLPIKDTKKELLRLLSKRIEELQAASK